MFFHRRRAKMAKYLWREDLAPREWDGMLAAIHGHPLQSASWGDARKVVDGIKNYRIAAFKDHQPVYLVRFEERRYLGFIKIAWVPRGPIFNPSTTDIALQEEFFQYLRKKGFLFCVTMPWRKSHSTEKVSAPTQTIWIDLTLGKDKLWSNLSKQFRYDVRRAKKMGIVVEKSSSPEDIRAFYELCETISRTKQFFLNGSASLMSHLLETATPNGVESLLFKVQSNDKLCGGAFVIRCGDSVHYMWAAVDREFSKLCIGEVIQWEIIEWAISQQCKLYDLEGIDPIKNPGTYLFKKKLGGEMITLPGNQIYLLNKYIRSAANLLCLPKLFGLSTV